MGLFDFGKSKQPPEYYLAQHSGENLRKWIGDHGFVIRAGNYGDKGTLDIKLYVDMEFSNSSHWLKYTSGAEPIPKKYKDRSFVKTGQVLEMAVEKGDAEASFYLAMLHKVGFDLSEMSNCYAETFCPDEAKAAAYMTIAQERGSVMEKAYQYILDRHLGGKNALYTDIDNIAERMCALASSKDEELENILGMERVRFGRLGVVLMAALTNCNCPKSSVSFAKLLGFVEENRYDMEENFRDIFAEYVIMPKEHAVRMHYSILNRVIKQAKAGDEAAAAALSQYNININTVLTWHAKLSQL